MYYNKKYPVFEIGVLAINYPDHTPNGRAKMGDIITSRIPIHYVMGTGVWRDRIRLMVEGVEEDEIPFLQTSNWDSDYRNDEGVNAFDKRRFCVPLHRLKETFPSFNLNRAKDTNDIYQPFMLLDEDNGKYLTLRKPLSVHGFVFDKLKREYL